MSEADEWNAKKRLDDVVLPAQQTRDLIDEVLWWHNALGNPVTVKDIMGRNRSIYVMAARADCMRRLRDVRGWSYPRIGKYFGGMDHTTALHHCRQKIVATREISIEKSQKNEAARIKWERKKYAEWLKKTPHALGGESSTTNGVSNGMG